MTTEDMRRAWAETSSRLERLEDKYSAMREEVINGKKRTALDNLAARYKRFSLLSLIFVFIAPFYAVNHVFTAEYRLWVPICMGVYFAIASSMDWWLYKKIESIDISTMTAEEVVATTALCRRRHFQFMAILIPMMLVIVALFILGSMDNEYMTIAIAGGLIVGLVLGVRQFINFMSEYKILRG